jgi:hypothetical protein
LHIEEMLTESLISLDTLFNSHANHPPCTKPGMPHWNYQKNKRASGDLPCGIQSILSN